MSSLPQDPDNTDWPYSGSELSRQDLGRLIYASICQVDGPVLDEMRRIREHAVVNNQEHNIRVALMHRCGWFVEWIEGPPDGIQALMERVALDPRHRSLRVVHESVGKPRLFKPWIGSIAEATESTGEFARRVMALHERHQKGKGYEPASVWRSLCSPLPGHVEVAAASEGRYQRVMMMSAARTDAFDLLHWLATREKRAVVHRRFAGAARDALDVESDYLDLPQQAAAGRRLIANARKGLAMGMTHAFLPDYAALVIVLDTDPERNEHLLDRLLTASQHVAHQPVIVGLGADSWFSDSLRSTTEARGLRWVEARTGDRAHDMATLWWALKRVLDALT
ncbi:BLUF domain-containing protein [Hydrogenophaga flava]|uniref:BLUF domain-containing protein n=1 Tax=Hydrogenophaga flava TaxID=65657 RepID=UPI00082448A6|nr:BLUF domain-containing protein [Hydrogenophaga flava]